MSTGRPAVLVIAGSDSSGGAGLQRDLRVLAELGLDAVCAVTAVTAQSDERVHAVHHVPPEIVRAQIDAARETRPVAAVKIGMLGTRATVEAVAKALCGLNVPIVLDPVLASSSGGALLDEDGRAALSELLLACTTLLTPNIPEAAVLAGRPQARDEDEMLDQARLIQSLGPEAVLIKGGHASGEESVDLLVTADGLTERLAAPRRHAAMRGTGCVIATAIAAHLAQGKPLSAACRLAKQNLWKDRQPSAQAHGESRCRQ